MNAGNPDLLTIIVLAAGLSRRMGDKNKLLLPVKGKSMLETTLDNILAAGVGEEILLVTGHESDRIRPLLAGRSVREIFNPDYTLGMTSSIQAGVRAASSGVAGYMICLADMPLIEPDIYRSIARLFSETHAVEPRTILQPVFESTPGNPVVLSAFYRAEILALDFPEGCKPIVQANREFVVQATLASDSILRDVDTDEAWENLPE